MTTVVSFGQESLMERDGIASVWFGYSTSAEAVKEYLRIR